MAIREETIEYTIEGVPYEGFVAWDDTVVGPRPGILVAHAWGGRSAFEDDKARWLAGLGYVGFALDMYGKGVRGGTTEENAALMTPLVEDRPRLQARMQAALEALKGLEPVDGSRCAAMGFCFGGLCVLDLARCGGDVQGVASVHGLFMPAPNTAGLPIRAKVLCLHGYDDPMADPDALLGLARELTDAGADWQVHAYGGTMHAFTNPEASDPDFGTVYSATASRRAHQAMEFFFAELFAA
jgi:dienelactone hydrolase